MQLKKNYVHLLLATILNFQVALAQTLSSCPCSGPLCVTNAQQLFNLLNPLNIPPLVTSGQTITICGIINLGEIDPDKFPLTVPAYVTLQGDYDFFNYNAGIHSGTTLKFPYLYKYGKQCGQQFTNASNTIPGGDNNGYNDELINTLPNYNTSAPPGAMPGSTPYIGAIIFKLMQGAQLKNLCIVDMNNDTLKITHAQGKKRAIINKTN